MCVTIAAGKAIPTELKKDAFALKKELDFDDEKTEVFKDSRDDEYRLAGVRDPKVVITTSHEPSSRLKMFAKEFKLLFPEAQRLNRGSYVLGDLVKTCVANEVTDLLLIHEHRGEPDGLIICHLPHGPTASFSLSNVVMAGDLSRSIASLFAPAVDAAGGLGQASAPCLFEKDNRIAACDLVQSLSSLLGRTMRPKLTHFL
jgi:U3 small nucleolar ribonucleoprotein protein IMP4